MSYPVFSSINLKIGGKYIDSKTGFIHGQKKTPLIPTWRAMSTLDFNSKNKKWTANLTGQYVGKMRLNNKPTNLPLNEKRYSEDYYLIQCALNYILVNWEFYAGCENLTNYTHSRCLQKFNSLANLAGGVYRRIEAASEIKIKTYNLESQQSFINQIHWQSHYIRIGAFDSGDFT